MRPDESTTAPWMDHPLDLDEMTQSYIEGLVKAREGEPWDPDTIVPQPFRRKCRDFCSDFYRELSMDRRSSLIFKIDERVLHSLSSRELGRLFAFGRLKEDLDEPFEIERALFDDYPAWQQLASEEIDKMTSIARLFGPHPFIYNDDPDVCSECCGCQHCDGCEGRADCECDCHFPIIGDPV